MNSEDRKMLNQIRAMLDDSVTQIDSDTRQRLDSIRALALTSPRALEPINDSEEDLVLAVQASLDDSVSDLDPQLLARLDAARKAAIAQKPPISPAAALWQQLKARLAPSGVSVPLGAFATACVLVTVATLFYQLPTRNAGQLVDGDVLLFASGDDIELYDNLEFYLWLADNGLPN